MENEDNANPPPQQHPHLKIPAFWASNPEAWFAMVEGQLVLKGVTQDTLKFYHVLGSLLETAVRSLGDLMRGPLRGRLHPAEDTAPGRPHSHRVPEDGEVARRRRRRPEAVRHAA
jgi:hypothetical protein